MKIKTRLLLILVLIIVGLNAVSFLLIYYLSLGYRIDQFQERLLQKATNTAKLLVDVEEIDENLLSIIDQNTASLPQEQVYVVDFEDNLIYGNPSRDLASIDKSLLNRIRLEHQITFSISDKEGVGVLYSGVYDRFVVLAYAKDVYGLNKLNFLKWILISIFVTASLLVYLIGWIYIKQAFKPFSEIISEMTEITARNLDKRLPVGKISDEITQLSQTFNSMLDRLEKSFITQKGFVSYASHELRTPLTKLLTQIDIALMNVATQDGHESVLRGIKEELMELRLLTDGLLNLFQFQSNRTKPVFTPYRIDELLMSSLRQLKRDRPKSKVSLNYNTIPDDEKFLLVNGHEELLILAFTNVIDNAVKFSGNMPVEIDLYADSAKIQIDISDRGSGIDPSDYKKIFEPFYRTKRATGTKGHGIGMAIVKEVLDMHSATIEIKSSSLGGTTFQFVFPHHF